MTAIGDSTPTRTCKGCKQELPATMDYFPPNKMGKYGLHTHCRPCKKQRDAERRARPDQQARQKAWRDANKDRIKQYNEEYRAAGYRSTDHVRAWYHANLDHSRAYNREKMRQLRAANPDKYRKIARQRYYADHGKALKIAREYAAKNRHAINERARERTKRLYRSDAWFNLCRKFAARLRRLIHDKAGLTTIEILGYTREELIAHIEKQFTKGMTWEKVLSGEIHIDHIRPVSSFDISDQDDPAMKDCWALTNLRPLWAKDNLSKGAQITHLI